MAREIAILEWCDLHLRSHGQRVALEEGSATETVQFGDNDRDARELALCGECAQLKLTLSEWRDLVLEVGAKLGTAPTAPLSPAARRKDAELGNVEYCPIPSCAKAGQPFTSRKVLTDHLRTAHGTTRIRVGMAHETTGRTVGLVCPRCQQEIMGWPGLSAHIRGAHRDLADLVRGKGKLREWYESQDGAIMPVAV